MSGIIGSKFNHRGSGTVAKVGTDGQHLLSSGAGKKHVFETVAASTYDDNKVQSNIAMLGFKVAVNNDLAKYNLVDQIIDEYEDASGVDTGASTNENLSSGVYNGRASTTPTRTVVNAETPIVDGDYTVYKWHSTGSFTSNATETTVDYLVIAGGGGGGRGAGAHVRAGGGGGAGGYRGSFASEASGGASASQTTLTLASGVTYTTTVGAGGTAASSPGQGGDGTASSIIGGSVSVATVGGGGGGAGGGNGRDGGSGGGTGSFNGGGGTGGTATANEGFAGGTSGASNYGGGGGGASQVGHTHTGTGHGGDGLASSITGASVTRAGGGGAGYSPVSPGGSGGTGGGGNGDGDTGAAVPGTANTGSGGGGTGTGTADGVGGTGIVILRVETSTEADGADLTLQSLDTTASTADPDYADMVILMENAEGTATLDTDIKGYISEDSGVTFTQGNLVEEGTWGTDKKIIAFHDLDISAQSGSAMCYKITTHNQSAGSKETKIHATSIGWR